MANIDRTVSPHDSVDANGRGYPDDGRGDPCAVPRRSRGSGCPRRYGDAEEQRQTLDALMKAIDEEPLKRSRLDLNGFSRFRDDQAVCVSRPSSTGRASGTQGNSFASVS